MKTNKILNKARSTKNDEFYTRYEDIEKELQHYEEHFIGKCVLCNCNDVIYKNFARFFYRNFKKLGLIKLVCTGYKVDGEHGKVCSYDGKEWTIKMLKGDGDFRSDECIELFKEADIVVTNPPFSLFRDFFNILIKYNKEFLIIGNGNAITYKEVFPYIMENKVWLGITMRGCQQSIFIVDENYNDSNTKVRECDGEMKYSTIVNSSAWFTNLEHNEHYKKLDINKTYISENYPKYDNYDAINVNKVCDIPCDYEGVMGVPISFLGKYSPTQFEILDARDIALNPKQKNKDSFLIKDADSSINGKPVYARICIRKRTIK